jgi:hypothetical protein
MKKSVFLVAAGCMLAVFIPGHIVAQAQGPYASIIPANLLDTINHRAIKDFNDRFENVEDAQWYKVKKGFVANFKQDGFRDRAYYNKNGRWQYSLKLYGENKLPLDVRTQVMSCYYNLAITFVEVIEIPEHLVYLVHLEGATTIKIVRVSDEGDMDVLQEFIKA